MARSQSELAQSIALAAHKGQVDKAGKPYIEHPAHVASVVQGDAAKAVAWLHDVVEDTEVTAQELEEMFGARVAHYVACETENKRRDLPPESTWKLRKLETITFLMEKADRNARMLALADKLSNLRSIERDVNSIGDKIWQRFNQKDKAMHGWFYRQTSEALRELEDYPAWQEYDRLIRKVFEQG